MPKSNEGTEEPKSPPSTDLRQPCAFFLKTGSCAFGDQCKFIHPADQAPTQYNSLGLPLRPGEPECAYYAKNLHCGYGASCKFNHSEPAFGWVPYPGIENYAVRPRPAYSGLPTYNQAEGNLGLQPQYAPNQTRDQLFMAGRPALSAQPYTPSQMPGAGQPYATSFASLQPYNVSMLPQGMSAYQQPMGLPLQQMGTPVAVPTSLYPQARYVHPQVQAMMQRPLAQPAMGQSMFSQQQLRGQLGLRPTPAGFPNVQRQGSTEASQYEGSVQSRPLAPRPLRSGTASGGPSRSRLSRDSPTSQ